MASLFPSINSQPRSEFTQLVTYVEETWDTKNILSLIYEAKSLASFSPHTFPIGSNQTDACSLRAEAILSLVTSGDGDQVMIITFTIPNKTIYPNWKVMANIEHVEILANELGRPTRIHDFDLYSGMTDINLMEQDSVLHLLYVEEARKIIESRNSNLNTCVHFKLKVTITRPKDLGKPPNSLVLYGSPALTDFGTLLNDSATADVTIKVLQEPHTNFPCHRAILSARSPVFRAMFCSYMQESQKNVLEIEDISADTMAHFISFLYSGHFQDSSWPQSLPKLAYAADKYCVESLKKLCDSHMIRIVTTKNALALAKLAAQHKLTNALADIRNFIRKYTDDISFDCIEIAEDK